MMEKGIFSKVFVQYPIVEAFTKVSNYGFSNVQFNFSNVGLPSLPPMVSEEVIDKVRKAVEVSGIFIPIISGTFNTLELDAEKRKSNMIGFRNVIESAKKLGIPYVSISTGSFDQENFWRAHQDNHTDNAWNLLFESLNEMLEVASKNEIVIVVEPEQANVVSSVEDTLRLMQHYQSPYLRVLFDAANIVTTADADQLKNKISYALKKLSDYIAIAHCKDCIVSSEKIEFAPIGKGNLPINYYLEELKKYYDGPVIMHGLEEDDIVYALETIKF